MLESHLLVALGRSETDGTACQTHVYRHQQGRQHILDQQQHHQRRQVHVAEIRHDPAYRRQNRLGDAVQEVANVPDHTVAGIEHAEREQHAEHAGQDQSPGKELDHKEQQLKEIGQQHADAPP